MELFFLILLFVIGSLLQAAGNKKRRRERLETPGQSGEAEQPDLMAEIRKAIEQLKEQREVERRPEGPGRRQLPSGVRRAAGRTITPFELDEEVEDVESLEVEPEVHSLEGAVDRPARVEVDQDDQAEAIIARRLKWAEEHGKRKSMAEHRAFDERIRAAQPPAAPPRDSRAELRKRFIWSEILGKPLALRDDSRHHDSGRP